MPYRLGRPDHLRSKARELPRSIPQQRHGGFHWVHPARLIGMISSNESLPLNPARFIGSAVFVRVPFRDTART